MDYVAAAKSALKTLRDAGRVLTMKRQVADATYDPATGTGDEATEWDQWEVVGVTLPAAAGKIQGSENKSTDLDKLVLTRVRFLIISALGPDGVAVNEPLPEDRLTLDGDDWRVVGCTRLNVDGTSIIYKIGVTA